MICPFSMLSDGFIVLRETLCHLSRCGSWRGNVVLSLASSEPGELGQLHCRHPALQHPSSHASLIGPGRPVVSARQTLVVWVIIHHVVFHIRANEM